MHPLLLTSFLVTSLIPTTLGQFTPLSLFVRAQPEGCQYPSLSDGTYIYFTNPTDSLHYSIYTPWTRFYPDAVRADLAEGGFQLGEQHGTNTSDACGWTIVDKVKKHGWVRGEISFRHIPGGGVTIKPAEARPPPADEEEITPRTGNVLAKTYPRPPGSMQVHLLNHTRRAAAEPTVELRSEHTPSNQTIGRIHNILVINSPEADILIMMLEITLPIIGVIGFLTIMLLLMRHIANVLYPENDESSSEAGDIELSSIRKSDSLKSDKTLVNSNPDPRKPSETTSLRTKSKSTDEFPFAKSGGIFAWRLARERAAPPRKKVCVPPRDRVGHGQAGQGTFFGLEMPAPPKSPLRQSSSVYSRSMDGLTLYPERNTGSWESQ